MGGHLWSGRLLPGRLLPERLWPPFCDLVTKRWSQTSNIQDHNKVSKLALYDQRPPPLSYQINQLTGKRYSCTVCDRTFSTNQRMRIHVEAEHTGITYPCRIRNLFWALFQGLILCIWIISCLWYMHWVSADSLFHSNPHHHSILGKYIYRLLITKMFYLFLLSSHSFLTFCLFMFDGQLFLVSYLSIASLLWTFTNCPKIYRKSVLHLLKVYCKSILKQMQYRFGVNFGTLSIT